MTGLETGEAALTLAATDFGHLVSRRPRAVLRPESARDIAALVRTAAEEGFSVAARGRGHSGYGQAQTDGVVIDMRTLSSIHAIGSDHVAVDAGATWGQVLEATTRRGLAPPVLTDYLGLSVGGTLSVGGIGGTSFRHGLHTDNVLELEVVTGDGAVHTCSWSKSPELFTAVLAGLGQCGVITRATVRLVPAPARARTFRLHYRSVADAIADQRTVIGDGRFDFVQGQIRYFQERQSCFVEAVAHYTPPARPLDNELLDGLSCQDSEIEDSGHLEFQRRLDEAESLLTGTGEWFHPHPWWNAFLPESTALPFLRRLSSRLTPEDLGAAGCVLFYPIFTRLIRAPLFRTPAEPVAFLIALLRFPPGDPARAAKQVRANEELYRAARALGAVTYPVGAIPFTQADWRHHFGAWWPMLSTARRRYDPHGVLTPGQGIFPGGRRPQAQPGL